jgi:hypothetical protein
MIKMFRKTTLERVEAGTLEKQQNRRNCTQGEHNTNYRHNRMTLLTYGNVEKNQIPFM